MGSNGGKMVDVSTLTGLREWCRDNNVDERRVARLARNGELRHMGVIQIGGDNGQWVIPSDAEPDALPERKRRGRGDGRRRFIVYATETEQRDIVSVVGAQNVIDPRERRAQRKRDAKPDNVKPATATAKPPSDGVRDAANALRGRK